MSVGAIPGVSFYVPHLTKVAAVSKTRRITRGGRVKGSATFRLPDDDDDRDSADRPTADPAAASTSAATLAALASLTRGG